MQAAIAVEAAAVAVAGSPPGGLGVGQDGGSRRVWASGCVAGSTPCCCCCSLLLPPLSPGIRAALVMPAAPPVAGLPSPPPAWAPETPPVLDRLVSEPPAGVGSSAEASDTAAVSAGRLGCWGQGPAAWPLLLSPGQCACPSTAGVPASVSTPVAPVDDTSELLRGSMLQPGATLQPGSTLQPAATPAACGLASSLLPACLAGRLHGGSEQMGGEGEASGRAHSPPPPSWSGAASGSLASLVWGLVNKGRAQGLGPGLRFKGWGPGIILLT